LMCGPYGVKPRG